MYKLIFFFMIKKKSHDGIVDNARENQNALYDYDRRAESNTTNVFHSIKYPPEQQEKS